MSKLSFVMLTVFHAAILLLTVGAIALAEETNTISEFKPTRLILEYKNNLIAAEFDKAPLTKVLQELEKKTGVHSILKDSYLSNDLLSITFKGATLEKGLRRILKSYTHSIYFDSSGDVNKIIILGAKDGYSRNSARIAAFNKSAPATSTSEQTTIADNQFMQSNSRHETSQYLTPSQQAED